MSFRERLQTKSFDVLTSVNAAGYSKRYLETQRLLTDTHRSATTRQEGGDLTREFRSQLKRIKMETGEGHSMYQLTLTADKDTILAEGKWKDDDYRERLVGDLFEFLLKRISSHCEPNYRRNTHKLFRIHALGSIEHYSKDPKLVPDKDFDGRVKFVKGTRKPLLKKVFPRVPPHTHAIVAVHSKWDDAFLDCFQRRPCRDDYLLNRDLIKGSAFEDWDRKVGSIQLEPVYDLSGWVRYLNKQSQGKWSNEQERRENKYQGCGFLTFDGTNTGTKK